MNHKIMFNRSTINKTIDNILNHALNNSIAEIVIESNDSELLVQYRQYGRLVNPMIFPPKLANGIFEEFKKLSGVKNKKTKKSLEGAFKIQKKGEKILLTIHFLPVEYGEKMIIKLKTEKTKLFNINELGLEDENLFKLQKYLDRKKGIILVTGPKESGTTSTIYSLLSYLNYPTLNIATLEEKIEYDFKHMNQAEINSKKGFDFNYGWEGLKKQDADVVYLSKLDPSIELNQLANMGTEKLVIIDMSSPDILDALLDFLKQKQNKTLSIDSLGLIINQKLANKVCPHCSRKHDLDELMLEQLKTKFDLDQEDVFKDFIFYKGDGCSNCNHTGHIGKTALFEILEIDQNLTDNIIKSGLNWRTKELIENHGDNILEDAFKKALKKEITIDEIIRLF